MFTHHIKKAVFVAGFGLISASQLSAMLLHNNNNLEVAVVPQGFFQSLTNKITKVPNSVETLSQKCDTGFSSLGNRFGDETQSLRLKVEETGNDCLRKIDDQASSLIRLIEASNANQERFFLQLNTNLSRYATKLDELSAQISHINERITMLEENIFTQNQDLYNRLRP